MENFLEQIFTVSIVNFKVTSIAYLSNDYTYLTNDYTWSTFDTPDIMSKARRAMYVRQIWIINTNNIKY